MHSDNPSRNQSLLFHITRSSMLVVFATTAFSADIVSSGSQICLRNPVGSNYTDLGYLASANGILNTNITYLSSLDDNNNNLYCYLTPSGLQSPVFRLFPGDHLQINLKNDLTEAHQISMNISQSNVCGAAVMTKASTNIHYHGTHTAPLCHQDESIFTTVNPGENFLYDLYFPQNHLPGLYAYHPHVHGLAEEAVLGGASGAIIIEGIEKFQPAVAGLAEKILIIRDTYLNANTSDANAPAADLSLNYIPIIYPNYTVPVFPIKPSERQFWRIVNAAADTILDLQLVYDGIVQPIEVVAIDGIPLDHQQTKKVDHMELGPMARVEFIVQGPSLAVEKASLVTLKIDTSPDGDNDPFRPVLDIKADQNAPAHSYRIPPVNKEQKQSLDRVSNLLLQTPSNYRKLYFSQHASDPNDPESPTDFFLTVDGQTETLFNADNPPAIETTQGSVEDWLIENRSGEPHVFHIHQLHFIPLARDDISVSPQAQQFMDTIIVPSWQGFGPYPSVKIRLDFRDSTVVGRFVYHCHILEHEDGGMMASIQVNPPAHSKAFTLSPDLSILAAMSAWLFNFHQGIFARQ